MIDNDSLFIISFILRAAINLRLTEYEKENSQLNRNYARAIVVVEIGMDPAHV